MRHLNIRALRSLLNSLDSLEEQEQELIVTRNKQAIARILPIQPAKQRPTHAELRELQHSSGITSVDLIRQDRDDR